MKKTIWTKRLRSEAETGPSSAGEHFELPSNHLSLTYDPVFFFFHFLRGLPINIFAHWQKNPLMREWLYKLCVCTNGILYILQEEWSWTAPHILIHKNTKAISNQIKVAECLWATYMQKSKKNNILFLFLPVNCTTNSWKGTL